MHMFSIFTKTKHVFLFIFKLLARLVLFDKPDNQMLSFHINEMSLKGRVIIYSIIGCPHCMQAKSTLQEHGLPFVDIGLEASPHLREHVKKRTGRTTVPQIFFNAIHVGGNDYLKKLVANKDEFDRLVSEVRDHPPPPDAPEIPDPSSALPDLQLFLDVSCEPDEYALLARDLKGSGIIQNHWQGLRMLKNSFSGKKFVEWIIATKGLDPERAVELGQQLLDQHFIQQLQNESKFEAADVYYRLVEDNQSTALNSGEVSSCQLKPVGKMGEDMRKLILKIYNAFLSADGKAVDYAGIGGSAEFSLYTQLSRQLVRLQLQDSRREERLAFFINVYNALVIHANVERGPPRNLWQRYKFFNDVRYIIGGLEYSLQDIENGVLRANRKGVGMLSVPFKKDDPRLKVSMEKNEPLIHFALVCGAKSCPPIKTYTADNIDGELRLAAQSFLEGDENCTVNIDKREVTLSKIFSWYKVDFGSDNAELLQFIHDHMAEGDKKKKISQLLMEGKSKIIWFDYDWGINSK